MIASPPSRWLAEAVFDVFGPYIAALIGINVAGQACSKLQDYTLWKLQIAVNYDLPPWPSTACATNRCRFTPTALAARS